MICRDWRVWVFMSLAAGGSLVMFWRWGTLPGPFISKDSGPHQRGYTDSLGHERMHTGHEDSSQPFTHNTPVLTDHHQTTHQSLDSEDKLLAPQWNNTNNRRVFYNRVPKCGSQSVSTVLFELQSPLHYVMFASEQYYPYNMSTNQQRDLAKYVNNLPHKSIYNRHLHYIDFTQYGELQPIYLNIIRDPVERAISQYYYQNELFQWNMSLDECVSKRLERCLGEENTQFVTPFFCGHHSFCRNGSTQSVQMAQRNVQLHYAFVGLTEALPQSFQLAEILLPEYFRGAGKLYADIANAEWKHTATSGKRGLSNATRATLATHMRADIEFYQWAKQHFFQLYKKHIS